MPDEYITRPEYEARQSEMKSEIVRIGMDASADRKDVQSKFDILSAKIDSARVSAWKLVAVSTVNFMIGGGLVAFLNYLHFPK